MLKKTEDISSNKTKSNRGLRAAALAYLVLLWEFFKIGTFTIGGGVAMIPQMQHVAVEQKKWLTEEEMLDCIALSQSLPGVIAVNMATFIGNKQRGIKGAAVATIGVVLPAFIAIILAVCLLEYIGDNRFVEGAFTGIKAAVCGLIVVTAIKLLKQVIKTGSARVFTVVISMASLIAVGIFQMQAVLVVMAGMVIGIVAFALPNDRAGGKREKKREGAEK